MTVGMAFFHDIPDSEDLEELLNYIDQTYVSGTFRQAQREGEAKL